MRARALLLYYGEIAKLNVPISVALALLSVASGSGPVVGFLLSYATAGSALAVYFHGSRRPNPYYFYQNMGLSRAYLFSRLFAANLAILFAFLFLRLLW